MDNITKL